MSKLPKQEFVISRDGKQKGLVRGRRDCQLAGCNGMQLLVVWADGKRTWPCTRGMETARVGWRIL